MLVINNINRCSEFTNNFILMGVYLSLLSFCCLFLKNVLYLTVFSVYHNKISEIIIETPGLYWTFKFTPSHTTDVINNRG